MKNKTEQQIAAANVKSGDKILVDGVYVLVFEVKQTLNFVTFRLSNGTNKRYAIAERLTCVVRQF